MHQVQDFDVEHKKPAKDTSDYWAFRTPTLSFENIKTTSLQNFSWPGRAFSPTISLRRASYRTRSFSCIEKEMEMGSERVSGLGCVVGDLKQRTREGKEREGR